MKDKRFIHFKIRMLVAYILALMPAMLHAQKPRQEEITVIAPYEPSIREAEKITIQPKIEPVKVSIPKYEIAISPRRFDVKASLEPIQAASPGADEQPTIYRNLVKAGFGNYTTPYFEFTANSLRNQNHALGVHLRHISSSGTIKEYGYPGFSDNFARVFAQKQFEKLVLSSSAQFQRNVIHHYGFVADSFPKPVFDFSKDNIKQWFNKAQGNLSLVSRNKEKYGLHYGSNLQYRFINDRFATNEHEFGGDAQIKTSFDIFSLPEQQQLVADLSVFHTNTNDSIANRKNTLVSFRPTLQFTYQEYEIKAGVRIEADHTNSTRLHIFPVAEAKLSLIEKRLALLAGMDGKVHKNTFRSLTDENEFVVSTLNYRNSIDKLRVYGALVGNLAKRVDASVDFEYTSTKASPFFISDTIAPFSRFRVIYDDMKVFRAGLSSSFQPSQKISINLGARYYSYKTDKEAEAWYQPRFDARIHGFFAISEKLSFSASVIANGKSWAKVFNGKTFEKAQMNAWFDLSAGGRYFYNKQLHFFIDARNLTAQRQYYWHNYPSQRVNVVAGAGFSF